MAILEEKEQNFSHFLKQLQKQNKKNIHKVANFNSYYPPLKA